MLLIPDVNTSIRRIDPYAYGTWKTLMMPQTTDVGFPSSGTAKWILPIGTPAGGDTTAPIPNVTVQPNKTKISRVSGQDVTSFTIQSDEAYTEYKIKKVASDTDDNTLGTLIETATGSWPANTDHVLDLTDDEIVNAGLSDGTHMIKIFVKDAAGNWSA